MAPHRGKYRKYCEGAYEQIIKNEILFHALDATCLKWLTIDIWQDHGAAKKMFAKTEIKPLFLRHALKSAFNFRGSVNIKSI